MKYLLFSIRIFTLIFFLSPSAQSIPSSCCINHFTCERCLVQCCKACTSSGLAGEGCMYCNFFGCNCEPCPDTKSCACGEPFRVNAAISLNSTFEEVDINQDKNVSIEEARAWWAQQPKESRGQLPKGMTIDDAFRDADKNNDDTITFEESGCANQSPSLTEPPE